MAPVALAAVAVGVYLIVHGNVSTTQPQASQTTRSVIKRTKDPRRTATDKPAFYTVRSGDTLSEIASRTHVALQQLIALNPSLTPPYSLQTGQRLRLRR